MKRVLVKLTFLAGLPVMVLMLLGQANAGPNVPTTYEPAWEPAAPGTAITTPANSPFGAQLPVIQYSPDGSRVVAAYEKRLDSSIEGNPDPWYITSTNDGASWSAPQPIYQSAAVASVEVELALDAAGVAHAVWVEGSGPFTLMYSKESNWPAAPLPIFSTDIFLAGPVVVASGSNTLDLVWSAHDLNQVPPDQNPNIYHSRSTNGGTSWSAVKRVYQSQPTSSFPDLAIDSEGILHLAWEEEASGILYTQGTVDGSNIVWEPPYLISDGEGIFEAKHPHILSYGSSTLVSFTNFSSFQQQWIFYTICNTDCSDESDWPGPYGLSSQPLGANTTDPAVINVELSYNGCAYAYYFGTEINGINPENEIVWGVNSCDGWSASLPDQATENATRSIYPAIAVHGTWIQLIYEQVSPSGRHIYVRRGAVEEPPPPGPDGIFLPLIRKK